MKISSKDILTQILCPPYCYSLTIWHKESLYRYSYQRETVYITSTIVV